MKIKMRNVPEYASNHNYIVYTKVDGENWFYSAYDNLQKASDIIQEYTDKNVCEFTQIEKI